GRCAGRLAAPALVGGEGTPPRGPRRQDHRHHLASSRASRRAPGPSAQRQATQDCRRVRDAFPGPAESTGPPPGHGAGDRREPASGRTDGGHRRHAGGGHQAGPQGLAAVSSATARAAPSPPPPSRFWLTRFLILRLLGLVYFFAFFSAAKQVLPLLGTD